MKRLLIFLPIFCFSTVLKAQTDTVITIKNTPYKHVDVIAKFTQGDFKNYISNNLQYNRHIQNTVKGLLTLIMEIGVDGTVSHAKILKSLSPSIDSEVLHIINTSPKWEPAMLNGQKVTMQMIFNISIGIKGSRTGSSTKDNPKKIKASVKKTVDSIDKKRVTIIKKNPMLVLPQHIDVKKDIPLKTKKHIPSVTKKTKTPVYKKAPPAVIIKKASVKKTIPATMPKQIVKKAPLLIIKMAKPIAIKKEPVTTINKTTSLIRKNRPIIKRAKKIVKGKKFEAISSNPVYPGGDLAFHRFLGENIHYPAKSKLNNIEGLVNTSFVIEKDGSISDVEVLSSPAEDLSQEAIRVLLSSPKWKPAIQSGLPVSYKFNITLHFSLQNKP